MPFTSKERSQASALRKKVRAGKTLSDDEARWLESYESQRTWKPPTKKKVGRRKAPKPAADPVETPGPVAPRTDPEPEPVAEVEAARIERWRPAPKQQPRDETPPAPVDPTEHASCTIKDCVHCKQLAGAVGQCGATGKVVWPKMSEDVARVWGGAAMGAMATGGIMARKLLGKSAEVIPPRDEDKARMAKAVQEVTYRRANFIGAIDDIVLAVGAVGTYGSHIVRAEGTKPKPAAQQRPRPADTPAPKSPAPAQAAPPPAPKQHPQGGPDDAQTTTSFYDAELLVL